MNEYDEFDDGSLDDVFKIFIIDKNSKKKVSVQLEDTETGEIVNLHEIFDQVQSYVTDQLKSKATNNTIQQIFPLMAQNLVHILPKILGKYSAAVMISNETIKYSFLSQMTASFYLLKFIQKNNLSIVTLEEDISDAEIEKYERLNHASSVMSLASIAGANSKEVVKEMLKHGSLTLEDIKELGINLDSGDTKDDKSN